MRTVTVTRWIAVGRYGHIKGEYATRADALRKAYKAAGDTVQRIQYSYKCHQWPADWIPRNANT